MSATQVFCPSCGTQQPLSDKCVQCGYGFPKQKVVGPGGDLEPTRPIGTAPPASRALPPPASPPAAAPPHPSATPVPGAPTGLPHSGAGAHHHPAHPAPHPAPLPKKSSATGILIGAALLVVAVIVGAIWFLRKTENSAGPNPAEQQAAEEAQTRIEQMTRERNAARQGTWSGKGSNKGRTADVSISADENGKIREATVSVHEGQEGILAGFQLDPKAEQILRELLSTYDPAKRTLEANIPFLRYDTWATPGPRTFKAIEGVERIPKKPNANTPDISIFVDYLVIESTEPDVLIQVGISRKGLLVFLNGSRRYESAMDRGRDVVSKQVRPGADQEITQFQDLVFNLSGGLNYVSGKVECSVGSPLAPAEGIGLSLARQP